jgi:hypothetical protein
MPRHWETWEEKLQRMDQDVELAKAKGGAALEKTIDQIRKRRTIYHNAYGFTDHSPKTQQLELTVVSSLVVFRESMRLLADQAKMGGQAQKEQHAWPELAAFDCYACHHDLKARSWRQERGYKSAPPGRPEMHAWPAALLPLGLEYLELGTKQSAGQDRAKLKELLQQLQKAFTAQPFGDPGAITASASALKDWSDEQLKKLRKNPCNLTSAQPLLVGLVTLPAKELLDFDSARQVSWAFAALAPELRSDLFLRKPGLALIDVQAKSLSAEQVERWREALTKLEDDLQLQLPQGQQAIVPEFLNKTMPKIADYNPEQIRQRLAFLRQELEKKTKE